jgi:hypothetical protein
MKKNRIKHDFQLIISLKIIRNNQKNIYLERWFKIKKCKKSKKSVPPIRRKLSEKLIQTRSL